eukprot:scaffold428164_cov39-Prasinocladus_malaysianus.AAC.1
MSSANKATHGGVHSTYETTTVRVQKWHVIGHRERLGIRREKVNLEVTLSFGMLRAGPLTLEAAMEEERAAAQ